MVLKGTQWSSRLLNEPQWYSKELNGTQWYSKELNGTQGYSKELKGTQWYSMVLNGTQGLRKGYSQGTPGYSQVPDRAKPEQLQPVSLPEDAARRLQPRSVAATGPAVRTIAASTPASTQWGPGDDPHEYPVSTPRDAGGFRPGRAEHARAPHAYPCGAPEYPKVP
jgi:hypothetical protein